ncbi:MAG: hypothetical protein KF767_07555 [Bdellovibrionaceae bacterium]|nr:hypothetical protein [Pseudobdellovibrionaceae bacterium]
MLNVRTFQTNEDFWPAFLRATLLKLDTFAIFVSISVVVYMLVAWISGPVAIEPVAGLAEVKTEYRARMATREPQSLPTPVAVRPVPVRPVAERMRANTNERQVVAVPVAARPKTIAMPAARPVKPVAKKRVEAPAKSAVKPKAKTAGRTVADAKRVSEKSRRN